MKEYILKEEVLDLLKTNANCLVGEEWVINYSKIKAEINNLKTLSYSETEGEVDDPKTFSYIDAALKEPVCPFYFTRMVEEEPPIVMTWGEYKVRSGNPKLIQKSFCLKKSDCGDCVCKGDKRRCEF